MKKVIILALDSSVIQSIADPHTIFTQANRFLATVGIPPLFDVHIAGLQQNVSLHNGIFNIQTEELYSFEYADLVIIPALAGNFKEGIQTNRDYIPWIHDQYDKGAEIVSLCVGAFFLASTGLLDGMKCSTHWGFQSEFRSMFPSIELVEGKIITECNRIYSSGGAHSYWNLLLHLLEKYTDRETAILAAKYYAIDIDRENQSSFAIFQGQKDHDDPDVLRVQQHIEKQIDKRISIDELAKLSCMGRRTFERRFKTATNNSVLEYIQRVKIEAAKRQFELSRKNISEVMYEVGYSDIKAFRDLFKKITGLSPFEYRNKYNKQGMMLEAVAQD